MILPQSPLLRAARPAALLTALGTSASLATSDLIAAPPVIANANFEQGADGTADHWGWWSRTGAGSATRTDTDPREGSHCVHIRHPAERDWAFSNDRRLPVRPGDAYQVSASAKVENGHARLAVVALNNGKLLSWDIGSATAGSATSGTASKRSPKFPQGCDQIYVRFTGGGETLALARRRPDQETTIDATIPRNRRSTGHATGARPRTDRPRFVAAPGQRQGLPRLAAAPDDPPDTAFDVFRETPGNPAEKITATPITRTTDFIDQARGAGRQAGSATPYARSSAAGEQTSELQPPAPNRAPAFSFKLDGDDKFQKVGIADLDGDGRYDFVIKQPERQHRSLRQLLEAEPGHLQARGLHARRHASSGATTSAGRSSGGSGTRPTWSTTSTATAGPRWRVKTGEGDPRDEDGRVQTGPEYLTILDGLTGKPITRIDWPSRELFADTSRPYNYASRNQLGVAYLDGKTPLPDRRARHLQRDRRGRLRARDGKLRRALAVGQPQAAAAQYRGQGAHWMHAADVDARRPRRGRHRLGRDRRQRRRPLDHRPGPSRPLLRRRHRPAAARPGDLLRHRDPPEGSATACAWSRPPPARSSGATRAHPPRARPAACAATSTPATPAPSATAPTPTRRRSSPGRDCAPPRARSSARRTWRLRPADRLLGRRPATRAVSGAAESPTTAATSTRPASKAAWSPWPTCWATGARRSSSSARRTADLHHHDPRRRPPPLPDAGPDLPHRRRPRRHGLLPGADAQLRPGNPEQPTLAHRLRGASILLAAHSPPSRNKGQDPIKRKTQKPKHHTSTLLRLHVPAWQQKPPHRARSIAAKASTPRLGSTPDSSILLPTMKTHIAATALALAPSCRPRPHPTNPRGLHRPVQRQGSRPVGGGSAPRTRRSGWPSARREARRQEGQEPRGHPASTGASRTANWSTTATGSTSPPKRTTATSNCCVEYKTVAKADSGIYLRGMPAGADLGLPPRRAASGRSAPTRARAGSGTTARARPARTRSSSPTSRSASGTASASSWSASIVSVWLNDKLVVDHARLENYFDRKGKPVPAKGPIQLQTHGGEIRWRNVFIREIDAGESKKIQKRAARVIPETR